MDGPPNHWITLARENATCGGDGSGPGLPPGTKLLFVKTGQPLPFYLYLRHEFNLVTCLVVYVNVSVMVRGCGYGLWL